MKNLGLLSKIALSFQNLHDFDLGMNEILSDLGSFIDVSRIYIFLNDTEQIVSNSFEWCDIDIVPQIENLQKFDYKHSPSFKKMLEVEGCICTSDIKNLPQDIIHIIKPQKIKSIVVYPLTIKKQIIGFMGFDECRYERLWEEEELAILKTISGLVSTAYERKFVQEDLMASETNFRSFFETIDDIFIVAGLSGQIIHCNKSLIDKLGYSLSELKRMHISELHPINKRPEAADIIASILRGEADSCHLEVESKFGSIYSVDTRVWIGKWNKEDCIFSISKDVTKELENLELFSTIFENNPLPMTITSIDEGRVKKINPAFRFKTGYTDNNIVGKTVEDLNFFIDLERLETIKNKQLKGEKIIDEELSVRCKDGSILIGLFSIEEITIQGKKALLTVMVDITERVELKSSLEDKYQKLDNIIEGTNLGTWEWNIQTGEAEFNEQWANMLGYSLADLEPISIETWNKLAHPEDLIASNKALEDYFDNNIQYYDCEVRMKHRDGRWIWFQDRGKLTEVDMDGKALKMYGTHSDISVRKEAEKALIESERRFFLALDKTEAGLWDVDLKNKTIFLSPMWKKILGYSDKEIENSIDTLENFIHPDDKRKIKQAGKQFINGKSDTYESISRFKHRDGSWRWILIRGGVLNCINNTPSRLIGTIIDVTLEREQSLELERFFSINLDLLCITTLDGYFIKTNKAWEDILGYSSDQLKERNFLDFIHPDDIQKTLNAMETLTENRDVTNFLNRYRSRDGSYRYIEWRSTPYKNSIYAAARDVTDRIKYEEKILEMSNRDALTNVYNRRYIFSRAREITEEYIRFNKIFSVCIIDIDDFKKINDKYGHHAGDYILKEFTKLIHNNLRPYDLLGRYGGEEFIIILNAIDAKDSRIVIKRILNIVRNKAFDFNGNKIKFTFSAGISTCTEVLGKEMIDQLVNIADQRMYDAKKTGKNEIIFQ